MQFIVTKQIAVEAESPEEAVAKIDEGKTIAVSANPRPAPPQARPFSGSPALAAKQG